MSNSLLERVLFLEEEFKNFLSPSDIIYDIQGLGDLVIEQIQQTEKRSRPEAVVELLKEVKKDDGLLNKFVAALSDRGYQRFVNPHDNRSRGDKFCQEYFDFIITYVKGELIQNIDAMEICGHLHTKCCIDTNDIDVIRQIKSTTGRIAACQELFRRVKMKRDDWAILFMETLRESGNEYLKEKILVGIPDPSQGSGIMTGPSQGNDIMPEPSQDYGIMQGPSQGYGIPPGPLEGYGIIPGPSQSYDLMPGSLQGNGIMPGPSQGNGIMPGPSQVDNREAGTSQQEEHPEIDDSDDSDDSDDEVKPLRFYAAGTDVMIRNTSNLC